MKKIASLVLAIFVIFAISYFAVFTYSSMGVKNAVFNRAQIQTIESIAHDYLVNNPQVLIEVAQKLQDQEAKKEAERIAKIKTTIPQHKNEIFLAQNSGRTVLANPDGTTFLTVITQYQCTHCKFTSLLVDNLIRNNPGLKVTVVQWPFFGNDAIYASKAALAAARQGKFAEANHALFESMNFLNKDEVDRIMKTIPGLDFAKLQIDMTDKALDDGLKINFKLCQDLGIVGTPTFIFANKDLTKFGFVAGQTPTIESDLNNALADVRNTGANMQQAPQPQIVVAPQQQTPQAQMVAPQQQAMPQPQVAAPQQQIAPQPQTPPAPNQ